MLQFLLSTFAEHHIAFNLLRYITFRAAAAMATSLLLSLWLGPRVVAWLRQLKLGQVVRLDGPNTHLGKAGTPTMGGVLIVATTAIAALLWGDIGSRFTITAVGALLATGAIGLMDDYLKVVRRSPRGLIGRYKIAGQVLVGLAVAAHLLLLSPGNVPANHTNLPFLSGVHFAIWIPLFVPWVIVVLTGSSNAVNLTDGVDGLVTGLTAIVGATLAVFAYLIGRVDTSAYLGLMYLPGAGELAVFCAALTGAALGFLWFNAHPAEVFMGDTGSLAIGGAIGTVALLLRIEFVLAILGGVFVMEAVSVMLQVSYFKWTKSRTGAGRRIFRMAPLHHHFEQIGWPESKVVVRFWIIGVLFAIIALATLKVR